MKVKILLVMVIMVLAMVGTAMAANVTYSWDASPSPDIDGYKFFRRSSLEDYDYSNPDWEGTETTVTFTDAPVNVLFHAVVRAYEGEYESVDSNEVSHMILSPPNNFRIYIEGGGIQ